MLNKMTASRTIGFKNEQEVNINTTKFLPTFEALRMC